MKRFCISGNATFQGAGSFFFDHQVEASNQKTALANFISKHRILIEGRTFKEQKLLAQAQNLKINIMDAGVVTPVVMVIQDDGMPIQSFSSPQYIDVYGCPANCPISNLDGQIRTDGSSGYATWSKKLEEGCRVYHGRLAGRAYVPAGPDAFMPDSDMRYNSAYWEEACELFVDQVNRQIVNYGRPITVPH